jgi:hypothetical protein
VGSNVLRETWSGGLRSEEPGRINQTVRRLKGKTIAICSTIEFRKTIEKIERWAEPQDR